MRVSKITIGRLFNLGSYEHIRYEVTVDIGENESAEEALIGVERIFAAINPKNKPYKSRDDIKRDRKRYAEMIALSDEEHARRHGPPNPEGEHVGFGYVGTREEFQARILQDIEESEANLNSWEATQVIARGMLDCLGATAEWKDAKLDWEE